MTSTAHPKHVELLTDEFSDRGMCDQAADDLACHVLANYPLAHKLGIDRFSQELAEHGMPSDQTRDVATLLFAFELLNRGATYDTVLSRLEVQPISHGDALAGALCASRIHRQAQRAEEIDPDAFFYLIAGASAITITITLITIALFA